MMDSLIFNFFNAEGRLGRLAYFGSLMAISLIGMLFIVTFVGISLAIGMPILAGVAYFIGAIAIGVSQIFLSIRRAHDFNKSGWLTLLFIIPFVNVIYMLILYFLPGTQGENNYGFQPETTGWQKGCTIFGLVMVILMGVGIAMYMPAIMQMQQLEPAAPAGNITQM